METQEYDETVKVIAENIKKISDSVSELLEGDLSEKAIFVLLAHSTKLPQGTIREVLYALCNMEHDYLKKEISE